MTTTPTKRIWPSREDWEADERARAEFTIEHGVNGWDYDGGSQPTFTIKEWDATAHANGKPKP